ncbi:maltoporin [Massilia rhizosphaerae]|uniref:maltoporin n=1 Tax=Massilia rhizosphaerae TaxID=2784389 RepID=UPI0018DDA393|nr:carbohydrate porin [Massilia rhizosphaerae]
MRMHIVAPAPALLALAFCFPASALDVQNYVRANAAANSAGGGQTCFALAGAGAKYRLGNECGVYGEMLLGQHLVRGDAGEDVKAYAMLNLGNEAASNNAKRPEGGWKIGLPQAYFAIEHVSGLGDAAVWLGRRYYKREGVNADDFLYWNPSGMGVGIENVPVGPMKFSYAYLHDDQQTMPIMRVGDTANRHDFQLRGVPVNPGGTLELGLALIRSDGERGHHGGSMATVQHRQRILAGAGENRLAVQWGTGAGTDNGATGDITNGRDVHRLRVVESWFAQVTRRFGGELVGVWQRDTAHDAAKVKTWASAGGRLSYALADHVKLLADVGHDRVAPQNGDVRRLTKFTAAVALTTAPGYFDRPELRLFFTHAHWNEAARAAARANDPLAANGVFGTALSGYTVGLTFENCW